MCRFSGFIEGLTNTKGQIVRNLCVCVYSFLKVFARINVFDEYSLYAHMHMNLYWANTPYVKKVST